MKLEGIHHVTAITGDAPGNVDFYTRVLGLRLVAKTVNQDDPSVYHLFYADEHGTPGRRPRPSSSTRAPRRGRAGAGMVHRIVSRVGSPEALDFWERRLAAEGVETERDGDRAALRRPRGAGARAGRSPAADEPLRAEHPEIPAEHALRGFDARARLQRATRAQRAACWSACSAPRRPATRPGSCAASGAAARSPTTRRRPSAASQSAGTVHHVAWGTTVAEHPQLARAPAPSRRASRRR